MPTRTASRRPDDATRTVADNLARQIIHASGLTIARGPLDVYLNAYVATAKWRIPKAAFKREVAAALRRRGATITSKANTAPSVARLETSARKIGVRSRREWLRENRGQTLDRTDTGWSEYLWKRDEAKVIPPGVLGDMSDEDARRFTNRLFAIYERALLGSKANTAPVHTKLAAHRRSLALRSGKTGRTSRSTVASRLASNRPHKSTAKASPKSAEMKRRRASLTAAERSAIAEARARDPKGWKTSLSRAGRDGDLRGALASAFAKLGAGGVFSYPVKG